MEIKSAAATSSLASPFSQIPLEERVMETNVRRKEIGTTMRSSLLKKLCIQKRLKVRKIKGIK
jgi:hypothetical protein